MKIFKLISFTMIILLVISCEDNLTELDNIGTQTADDYFNDPENALAGLNSCYAALQDDEYFIYGDILSDDAIKGGSSLFDWADRQYLKDFNANSGNAASEGIWSLMYTGIVRSNEVINAIPNATFDEDLKSRIIGEAKFLRAYFYLRLVSLYGGVPLITGDLSVDDLAVPRSTEKDVFDLIKSDLDESISVLPEKNEYALSDLGRVTKGAAQMLKVRALMQETAFANNEVLASSTDYNVDLNAVWNEVFSLTSEIINSGQYALANNFATIFEEEGENNVESVFEVQHKQTNNEWGESVGNTTIVQMGNRDDWGWCFNLPTDALYNTYLTTDPRLFNTIYGQEFGILYGIPQTWDKQLWTLEDDSTKDFVSSCRLNRKYALAKEDRASNHNNQDVNKRLMRYAEVLLAHAEAAYYVGQEGVARNTINLIRSRAENSTMPLGSKEGQTNNYSYDALSGAKVPAITSTGEDLLLDIWKERRMELAMEGIRYFDIIRTGRLELLPNESNYRSHDGLLPIPVGDVNAFEIAQNKGY
ncbi:SusD-like protein [Formosa agariphila KMM 3901]|uniref:SusD-like protein n=1 Tax=Formosa agariphila (strain DSM 15362 / KCTC 12365 / LMG 23005 / KMM 3901 / M-2Alg 35-1) TaxID=1347342 RepID=T2KQP5_FORAG|nr:RagB/SusD family nutrient uptake outer membrane protein [Formosa agariphila]CDF80808.1 SusD-like protein [Formosa agariphila KMM 3901]